MCYRGQKVVCVTDYRLPHCPFKNGVYTVSEVLENPDLTGRPVWCSGVPMSAGWLDPAYGNTWLRLAEIPQQPHYVRAIAFRPLRPTSIEVFRELLEPAEGRDTAASDTDKKPAAGRVTRRPKRKPNLGGRPPTRAERREWLQTHGPQLAPYLLFPWDRP